MDIKDLNDSFNDLQTYSDAQFRTIVELRKEIDKLKSENESLRTMLEGNLPNIDLHVTDLGIGVSNEQLICETQILLLKNDAMIRPLTMEEARKLEIFTTVLDRVKRGSKDTVDIEVNKLSNNDLLQIINESK